MRHFVSIFSALTLALIIGSQAVAQQPPANSPSGGTPITTLPTNVVGPQPAKTLKEHLVGTWTLVSNYNFRQDGSKFEPFGPNPKGLLTLGGGYFSVQLMSSNLPKFASNNRMESTPEENKAIVQGIVSYFGTYSFSEADSMLHFHVESSSFPNWIGADQKRAISITGNEMTYASTTPSNGAKGGELIWRRPQ